MRQVLLLFFLSALLEVGANYLIMYGIDGPHVWEMYPLDGSQQPPAPPPL